MNKIELLGHTCIGASHIINGKPCQDSSISYTWEKGRLIIVSDGHGSDKYFRSDRGSKIAVEVTKEALISFVENFNEVESIPNYKARGISGVTDESSDDYTPFDYDYESTFRHLFDYIVSKWYRLITEDWQNNPPTEEEYEKADTSNLGKLKQFYSNNNPNLAKAYGCTLIAAVRAKDYWFAFQLGDGKCIAFKEDGTWFEPIPWDSRCFLNQTTSLSGQGSESFRYCYGAKHVPALFIGSDGIDDSYPPISCLANWYKLILKKIEERDVIKVQEMLVDYLPKLSKQGSKDDMSLRLWVDTSILSNLYNNIIKTDIVERKEQCNTLEQEISNIETDIFMIKNSIQTITNNINEIRQKLEQEKSHQYTLKNFIEQLKSQLLKKESEYDKEETTIIQKEKEIEKQNNSLLTTNDKLTQAEGNKQKKQQELDRIKQEITEAEELLKKNNSIEDKPVKDTHKTNSDI